MCLQGELDYYVTCPKVSCEVSTTRCLSAYLLFYQASYLVVFYSHDVAAQLAAVLHLHKISYASARNSWQYSDLPLWA